MALKDKEKEKKRPYLNRLASKTWDKVSDPDTYKKALGDYAKTNLGIDLEKDSRPGDYLKDVAGRSKEYSRINRYTGIAPVAEMGKDLWEGLGKTGQGIVSGAKWLGSPVSGQASTQKDQDQKKAPQIKSTSQNTNKEGVFTNADLKKYQGDQDISGSGDRFFMKTEGNVLPVNQAKRDLFNSKLQAMARGESLEPVSEQERLQAEMDNLYGNLLQGQRMESSWREKPLKQPGQEMMKEKLERLQDQLMRGKELKSASDLNIKTQRLQNQSEERTAKMNMLAEMAGQSQDKGFDQSDIVKTAMKLRENDPSMTLTKALQKARKAYQQAPSIPQDLLRGEKQGQAKNKETTERAKLSQQEKLAQIIEKLQALRG